MSQPMETLSEEDIKRLYITPALGLKGWTGEDFSMETAYPFTDGQIIIKGNLDFRGKRKVADYVLYHNRATPLAIVEAKRAVYSASHGLQQAMTYCRMMNIPFAYSSNGKAFAEHDFLTGKERQFPMDAFPTKDELLLRFRQESNEGQGITPEEMRLIDQPYYTGSGTYPPRYYQRNAINLTLGAIARGQRRLLLVMATGTGKTYTAFQIVYRLLKAKLVRKVLYLADRNILVDQSIEQDFKPLGKTIHKVNFQQDQGTGVTAYQVYFALYQQLLGQQGEKNYEKLFRPEFFDMVIVDECHRGSAQEDSNWREILEYFQGAIQLGMTATPKETKYTSSIAYFGAPVYQYSLREGIEDGFLAPFRVLNITTNIGDEWRPLKGQLDVNGHVIEDRIYNNQDYDYNIVIQDRTREVAHQITLFLQQTDPMAKTIVFCADEAHAERMRQALVNENSDLVRKNPDYVVRITGSDEYGKLKLDYFISAGEPYPVIATTSKLLSTGVDCKMVKLIVLDQRINSMTEFKQIVGRGTRIREKEGKTHFTIMDFRNVTRLFADPDWDGPVEQVEGYTPATGDNNKEPSGIINEPPEPIYRPIVDREGCEVRITNKVVSVYDTDGKLLRTESIVDYTRRNILGEYATLDDFLRCWNQAQRKTDIANLLKAEGIDLQKLKQDNGMTEVDDFDFICHLAYGRKPLTRRERAESVRKRDIFGKYGPQARKVLEALLDKYAIEGVAELESPAVLELDPLRQFGSPSRIASLFGGSEGYRTAVRELKAQIYA